MVGGFERARDRFQKDKDPALTFSIACTIPRAEWADASNTDDNDFRWAADVKVQLEFTVQSSWRESGAEADIDALGDYWVAGERFAMSVEKENARTSQLLSYTRSAHNPIDYQVTTTTARDAQVRELAWRLAPIFSPDTSGGRQRGAARGLLGRFQEQTAPQDLFFDLFHPLTYGSFKLQRVGEGIRTFHFSVEECRRPSAAMPVVSLGNHGENLAAVVRQLRHNRASQWADAVAFVSCLLPNLSDVTCEASPGRMLTLKFVPNDGTPWAADEVSDGTVLAVALAAALLDPGATLVVLDEPEIGLHPWVVRKLIEFCDGLSGRQAVLMTHSPVILERVHPSRVMIAIPRDGHADVVPLEDLDPDVGMLVDSGVTDVARLLDNGAIAEAVPTFL